MSDQASSNDDAAFFQEVLREFLNEAGHMLEECEECYLKLEDPAAREEELAKIFRVAHSLKGTGAAVGLKCIPGFAHAVEDLLSVLRSDPKKLSSEIVSLLLACGDAIKQRICAMKQGPYGEWSIQELKNRVVATTEQLKAGSTGSAAPSHPTATPGASSPAAMTWDEDLANTTKQAVAQTAQSGKPGAGTMKVDAERIDQVLDLVGELVVLKSQLMNRANHYAQDQALGHVISLMDKTVREIQDRALSMRMTPLKSLFLKCQRVIRDVSVTLGKQVDIQLSGEDTEIDRMMVEMIADPLLHIVRNAVDHGVETPEKRIEKGKPAKASIRLIAGYVGGRVMLRIEDDGGGINREKVLKKAASLGLVPGGASLDSIPDAQVNEFLFAPGFSTADKVSDLSGRGVGLDVVKTNIEKLRGTVEIQSKPGKGTSFIITLPLTASITDGMIMEVGDQKFIIPMENIRDLIELSDSKVTTVGPKERYLSVRDGLVPLVRLGDFVGRRVQAERDVQGARSRMVAIVENGAKGLGIEVDRVIGQAQVVLKPLGDGLKGVQGLAGAAILGDGGVGLVLDVDGIGRALRRAG